MIECAIVVTLVALMAVGAVLAIGWRSGRTFSSLADWSAETEREAAPKPRGDSRSNNSAPNADNTLTDTADPSRTVLQIDARTLACMLAGFALCGYFLTRRKRVSDKRQLEQMTADRALLEQLDEKRFVKRQQILKLLSSDPTALLENRVEVSQLMTTRLRTVRAATTVDHMQSLVRNDHLRHFPVVDERGTLIGIVSDRDLLGQSGRRAGDVMSKSLVTVSPSTKVSPATTLMLNSNISCLPVMDGTKLAGLLTTTDLIMTLQSALQLLQRSPTEEGQPANSE